MPIIHPIQARKTSIVANFVDLPALRDQFGRRLDNDRLAVFFRTLFAKKEAPTADR